MIHLIFRIPEFPLDFLQIRSIDSVTFSIECISRLVPAILTQKARSYADENGLIVRIGRRVMVDRMKFDRLCDREG